MNIRKRAFSYWIPVAIFLVILLCGTIGKPLAVGNDSKEKVVSFGEGKITGKNHMYINVQAASEKDKPQIERIVQSLGGTIVKGIDEKGLNLRVSLPGDRINDLAGLYSIERIEPYKTPSFLNDRSSGIIGGWQLQSPGYILPGGLSGSGQIVAVADSGLDIGVNGNNIHPDFRTQPGMPPKIVELRSVAGNLLPSDPVGHGTHVAGSIVGTGAASGGKFRGVAPNAGLYFQSILNSRDQPDPPANLSELFDPAYRAGARIHVNSWGTQINGYTTTSSQIDTYVRSHPDFLVVFGAGNSGSGPNGKGTLVAEANSKNALIVGASENARPGFGEDSDRYSDVAIFSSRGPAADGRIRPDLLAPGTAIISARSSLAPTNFESNSFYTTMDGTSSAAALVAGSATLLREYFMSQNQGNSPSASLIKAALLNGAVKLGLSKMQEGFGLTDVQGTVLSLQNSTVLYEDNKKGLEQGSFKEYIYKVDNAGDPIRVTLSWTDPAAAPGESGNALVNDLDLIVTGPDGRSISGNDLEGQGMPDRLNNTEQVIIENPVPGSYRIKVTGTGIKVDAVPDKPGVNQDYSIAYGQPMQKGIISSASETGKIVLAGNRPLNIQPGASVHLAREGLSRDLKQNDFKMQAGSDIYYSSSSGKISDLYVSYTDIFAASIKGYEVDGQKRLTELRSNYSEGGFNLSRSPAARLLVNGSPAALAEEVLPGSDVMGVMNPGTGELWQADVAYSLKKGKVDSVNPLLRRLTLFNGGNYQLNRMASIKVENKWNKVSFYDEPFTRAGSDCLQCLPLGSEVLLVVSPLTREVGSIYSENRIISGRVVRALSWGRIYLEGNNYYDFSRDALILYDGQEAPAYSVRPGDWIEGILSTGSDHQFIKLEVYSQVLFGRVKEVKAVKNSVQIESKSGRSLEYVLTKEISPFLNGKPAALEQIKSGDIVRIAVNDQGEAIKLDAATPQDERIVIKHLTSYNGYTRIESGEGKKYLLAPYSTVLKEGTPVMPEDLASGEEARLTVLYSPLTESGIVYEVDARARPGAEVPKLNLYLKPRTEKDALKIKGISSVSTVNVFVDGAACPRPPVDKDGSFETDVNIRDNGSHTISISVVDRASGGISSTSRVLYWNPQESENADFNGIWAEKDILGSVERGFIQMYPDGSFRPEEAMTRGDFSKALSLITCVLPSNVRNSEAPATRLEGVAMLWSAARTMGLKEKNNSAADPPFEDWPVIPPWGREPVLSSHKNGLIIGTPEGRLDPHRYLTRAEAAALISRLEETVTSQDSKTHP